MGLARQALRQFLSATVPPKWWLARGSWEPPTLALTFDDGPHPDNTSRVLDALARWHAMGTFFVVGQAAERHPKLIERIVQEGHALGNHTWTHSEPATTSATTFLEEISRTDRWLQDHAGFRPHWVRPPKGELSCRKLTGLWRQGHGIALWNVDPRDYRMDANETARS